MKWISRSHIHIDRVAGPWLIKRFIDAQAEFLFVTPGLVSEVAKAEDAIPFDTKGAELGHQENHCSFVSIINKYGLKDPALLELAEVVNAADMGNMDANPYARGLDAVATGYSLLYSDDYQNVEQQFPVYDALYAFFRLKCAQGKTK
jgi:hypothetical protein